MELVLIGNVPHTAAGKVIDFARKHGFSVLRFGHPPSAYTLSVIHDYLCTEVPRPPLARLSAIRLPQAMNVHPEFRTQVEALLDEACIRTAADLACATFASFMQLDGPHRRSHMLPRLYVLEFMIEHDWCFRDLNPARSFPTPVSGHPMLDQTTINSLRREGISRLELLVFVTEKEVLTFDSIGGKRLEVIKTALRAKGLTLRPTR